VAVLTIWKSLTEAEYLAVKAVLAKLEETEQQFSQPFRDHPIEQVREIDDMRAMMRAAVEGYEAANKEQE
jgi:hypothetical protein